MPSGFDLGRRRFLGGTGMMLASAPFLLGTVDANAREPREFAALGRGEAWLNSVRLSASSLLGKVVLVQFGTYTCINWLRTLPYVRGWAHKYRELVVLGVHTPEFEFEKNIDNVSRAVRQMRIAYPVVIDNEYAIWRAFNNQYWPALYLFDARGRVRHHRFGEGDYGASERAIQQLLVEAGVAVGDQTLLAAEADGPEAPADWNNLRSGENYVGYSRTENFSSPGGAESDRRHSYAAPTRFTLNEWALVGEWTMTKGSSVLSGPTGRIAYRFHARDLHLVMGPLRQGHSVRFRVSMDGQPPNLAHGLDVDDSGRGVVTDQRLHQLIRQPGAIADRTFEIEFLDTGVEAFAFTFG